MIVASIQHIRTFFDINPHTYGIIAQHKSTVTVTSPFPHLQIEQLLLLLLLTRTRTGMLSPAYYYE